MAARPVAERAAIVKRVAELFTERAADLRADHQGDGQGPQAVGEAEFCSDIFNYYADNGPGLIADKPLPGHDDRPGPVPPVGPVLGVMPWNYPYYQVARFAAPNLIVGNTVILKHAENCPTSALAIAQIMRDAGVPEGVYINLFATHEQVAAMIADPRLRGVSLTGSERAGRRVAEGRPQPEEGRPRARRLRPLHHPRHRRRRRAQPRPPGAPGWRTSARPATPTSG